MWRSMEEVVRELKEEGILLEEEEEEEEQVKRKKTEGGLPPGFRFHPTDEELITYYLASKVFTSTTSNNNNNNNPANLLLSNCYPGVQIAEVDLTRCEPWDLPERAKMGEREWYLYSLRDRKYPSGLRTNRATETGYWKATGKDRQVYASSITTAPPATGGAGGVLIGMKKTLVFYQGRAPRGVKTKWVMHEYRLDGHFSSFRLSSKEEWVICRIFHKNVDKKNPAIMHNPPLPLSPFLSTLPHLQELKTSSTTITTQTVADNSLLHSLLSNPLPNFSSISGSHPIFPPPNTSIATSVNMPWLSTTNAAATAAVSATKQQQQQNWLDRICPQVQIQYFQHQYQCHDHDNQPMILDQTMDIHPHPHPLPNTNTYSNAAATSSDHHEDTHGDTTAAAAAVHVDVGVSPSFAVAALDRMLNHTINYHPAESWSFHYP